MRTTEHRYPRAVRETADHPARLYAGVLAKIGFLISDGTVLADGVEACAVSPGGGA